jgi:hypothetical protein
MNENIAITSANLNFDFLSYAIVTSKAWQIISGTRLIVGLVTDPMVDPRLVEFLESKVIIQQIPQLPGVDSGVQSKFSRLWLAQNREFSKKNITIVDLDMIPLSDARNCLLRECQDKQFLKWGFDHIAYSQPPELKKWPMDGSTSTGFGFQEVVNPRNLTLAALVQEWSNLPNIGKGNPFNKPVNFSDETLLREIWPETNSLEIVELGRNLLEKSRMAGRIDRAKSLPVRKVEKLINQGKFEFHGPRPFPFSTRFGRSILSYLQLPYREYCADMAVMQEFLS